MTDRDATGTGGVDPGEAEPPDGADTGRGRDVVVPMPLYKVVTVFSTLIAVVGVVFGFMLLDAATLNVSFLGGLIRGLLSFLGLRVAESVLTTVLAALGLATIALGAGVYVIGTRFRARGMGKSQEDSNEESNNNG
ncbi:MAG: hypothetical protein ABEI27_11510 [Halobellus sp.]|uniref:DUF7315 family membrane protein n=1 Tax=Halobellus sp. TaxID=1979212 RepID=UPI0035D4CCAB